MVLFFETEVFFAWAACVPMVVGGALVGLARRPGAWVAYTCLLCAQLPAVVLWFELATRIAGRSACLHDMAGLGLACVWLFAGPVLIVIARMKSVGRHPGAGELVAHGALWTMTQWVAFAFDMRV